MVVNIYRNDWKKFVYIEDVKLHGWRNKII